jgi:hypothetical protein
MLSFLLKEYDEDWVKFLNNIDAECYILIKDENRKIIEEENVKIIFSNDISSEIKNLNIKSIFIDYELDIKFNNIENIKIIENKYEKEIFKGYDAYALRKEKVEGFIYLPYFFDFDFFSKFKSKFKIFEKKKRILILSKNVTIDLAIILEKIFPILKNNIEVIFYKIDLSNRKNMIFINRKLSKEERANLYFYSSVIFTFENFKKEILEAMSMGKFVYTLDASFGSLRFSLEDNLLSKLKKAIEFGEFYKEMIERAKNYSIENSSKIFEEELQRIKII